MSVIRLDNYIDAYRLKAQSRDLHDMAGRGSKTELTKRVNAWIVDEMQLGPEDKLLDVGCGDGCLLRMAEDKVATRTGVVPTPEEQRRLQQVVPGATILTGLVQSLPLPPAAASKIVCNAVVMYLRIPEVVQTALAEIARVAKPGARLWIGEIPDSDDYVRLRQYQGDSVVGLLGHVLTKDGPRAFAGMIRRLARSAFGQDEIVLNSAGLFYMAPTEFLRLCEPSGLRIQKYFRHIELDGEGKVIESPFRYNYIFTKP